MAEVINEEVKAVEAPAETMEDFSNELEHSMREIAVGDIVEGTVSGVTDSEVTVDLQYYAEGIIRAQDYSADPSFSIKNDVKAGDKVSAEVLRMDDGHGNILLSRRNAEDALSWQNFKKQLENKDVIDVTIKEAVKGGVVTFVKGVRAFIPASKLALEYVEDLTTWVGKTVPAYLITVDSEKKRLVLSSRDVLKDRKDQEKADFVSNLKEGLVTEGTVESLQSYGAFVGLGNGVDGLVHISQITGTKRLKHPKEMLAVGDKVKVKVLSVKDGKISLSMKACEEVPEVKAEPVKEEKVVLPKTEKLTTNLGSLLKGLKLD